MNISPSTGLNTTPAVTSPRSSSPISVAQNGTPPIDLDSREDVIAFNEALPCGAKLIRAETQGKFTVATFELTERPGPGECGPGTGSTASSSMPRTAASPS